MRLLFAIVLLAVAPAGAAGAGAPKPVAAPASAGATRDWTRTVARAPSGGFLIGNPAAKVRLVEYMSYTCGHCAQFAADSRVALMRDHVARGTVAFEVRNFVLNGLDFTAALAARCGGAARFKGNHDAIFAAQPSILEKGSRFDAAAAGSDPVKGMQAWARASGIAALMAQRGVPAAALDRCIADRAEQARIQAMTRDASDVKRLRGTPSFLIGDRAIDANTWAGVDAELRAATN